jgi:hypothetical protein
MPVRTARGLSNSIQFAVVMPLLMLISLGIIQAGVWLHGRNVAAEAANAAADLARTYGGDHGEAERSARRIAAVGGLEDVEVDIDPDGRIVRVRLSARAPMIFAIGLGRIASTATAPMERVTSP